MTEHIRTIQRQISILPDHILAIDLLIFRRHEQHTPTPWFKLAEYCVLLLSAIEQLRTPASAYIQSSEPNQLNMLSLSASYLTTDNQLDTIETNMLTKILASEHKYSTSKTQSTQDNSSEEAYAPIIALASLIEERLNDLLLEMAFKLKKLRRSPRIPTQQNPLAQSLWNAKQVLEPHTANLYATLANQIGPTPSVDV